MRSLDNLSIDDIIEAMNSKKVKNGQSKMTQSEISLLKSIVSNRESIQRPICKETTNVINSIEQINGFRGLGYDHIVEDGLRKGLKAGDVALNILKAMPQDEIERRQAVNYMVNYANKLR